jgi:beta-lactamase class A
MRIRPTLRFLPALLAAVGVLAAAAGAHALGPAAAPRATVAAPAPPLDSLRERLAARIAELRRAVPTAEVAVAVRDLATGAAVDIASDVPFHPASTMKVPVMIELFRQADAGRVRLDQPVLLANAFGSIVDGSPYRLDPADDSDSALYARVGTRVELRELNRRMIVRSSNLATNALIAVLGAGRVTATAHALGATRTRVLRGVEDGPAFRRGLNNVITAADLATLLAAIERGDAASAGACAAMRETLRAQEFNDEIPAGLPAGTPVAHKTGWITGVLHDGAVVYPPSRSPYVLVVLTRGVPDTPTARATIVALSRLTWEALGGRVAARE